MIKLLAKIVLPLAVVAGSLGGAAAIVRNAPVARPRPPERHVPIVRCVRAQNEDLRLDVETYGTVQPRTTIDIVPQVAGKAVFVSPSLCAGGFLKAGEVVLRIDPRDYELAVTQAKAGVAQAQAVLERTQAEAGVARKEWEGYGEGEPDPLVVREPQLAEARAQLAAAGARLAAAELALERTRIVAPFDARVRSRRVDRDQYVVAGQAVASIYAIDYAEVRLAIPDDKAPFLDLPLARSAEDGGGPQVALHATGAGAQSTWTGRIVRTEAEVDPQSRVIRCIARVDRPYDRDPPLLVGSYVRAVIHGKQAAGVVVIPEIGLRGSNRVWCVDGESKLRIRSVTVLRRLPGRVALADGLAAGERVCVTPLDPVVDGMAVRLETDS